MSIARKIKISPWHLAGGAILYGGTTYAVYSYMNAHQLPSNSSNDSGKESGGRSAFDAIADRYDSAVGSEEWSMGYPLLRKWLLNHASGDVLEISAGTGRNLPHYSMSSLRSLTLCDLSEPMLKLAEEKFFDDLGLGEKGTPVRFCLSDAHCMVSSKAESQVHTLPTLRQRSRRLEERSHQGLESYKSGDKISTGAFSRFFRIGSGSDLVKSTSDDLSKPISNPITSNYNPGSQSKQGDTSTASSPWISSWIKPWTWFKTPTCNCCDRAFPGCGFLVRCHSGTTDDGQPLSKFASASFDTVVDSFGLCSHEDPVQVLREASRVCKPDGRILLLEHGRAHYDLLNNRLDNSAEEHHKKWGCYWNRDITEIIKKAGLRIEKISRWHFGTTYIIIARPSKDVS